MEREVKRTKELVFKTIDIVVCQFILFGLMIILSLHYIVPFFPILFLFNLCFWVGHPLFLRYILKRKWFECTKDYYLKIKYILLPWLIMELVVLLYYHKATYLIIKTIIEEYN